MTNPVINENLRFATKTFVEFIDLTGRIKNLLFARIKWMAFRADINSHIVFTVRRASCERIAAAAFNVYVVVLWMSISFHVDSASNKYAATGVIDSVCCD